MAGRHAWDPEQVKAWIDDDPDPITRDELSGLLDAALTDRLITIGAMAPDDL